jgi:hypothetical protein
MEMLDMDSQECSSHKDLRPSSIIQCEAHVQKVLEAISNFMNPFEVDNKDVLYCLSSGSPTPNYMDVDLLQSDKK